MSIKAVMVARRDFVLPSADINCSFLWRTGTSAAYAAWSHSGEFDVFTYRVVTVEYHWFIARTQPCFLELERTRFAILIPDTQDGRVIPARCTAVVGFDGAFYIGYCIALRIRDCDCSLAAGGRSLHAWYLHCDF